ncbi:uncharacterized protein LOC128728544 [Anopheles nili]|uniref:uncharacterized protein LOC128728544 n=1 Tax=Anopheles nili TaxID=185578 RepID=UPI00237A54BC|nr:uncharacterized protein LOC128728544 [Anopheles nili]
MEVECPVCTLYLRSGMNLAEHLDTHPKEKVIKALVTMSMRQGAMSECAMGYNELDMEEADSYEAPVQSSVRSTDRGTTAATGTGDTSLRIYDTQTAQAVIVDPAVLTTSNTVQAAPGTSSQLALLRTINVNGQPSYQLNNVTFVKREAVQLPSTMPPSAAPVVQQPAASAPSQLVGATSSSGPISGVHTELATVTVTTTGAGAGASTSTTVYPRYTNELYSGPPPPYSTAITSSVTNQMTQIQQEPQQYQLQQVPPQQQQKIQLSTHTTATLLPPVVPTSVAGQASSAKPSYNEPSTSAFKHYATPPHRPYDQVNRLTTHIPQPAQLSATFGDTLHDGLLNSRMQPSRQVHPIAYTTQKPMYEQANTNLQPVVNASATSTPKPNDVKVLSNVKLQDGTKGFPKILMQLEAGEMSILGDKTTIIPGSSTVRAAAYAQNASNRILLPMVKPEYVGVCGQPLAGVPVCATYEQGMEEAELQVMPPMQPMQLMQPMQQEHEALYEQSLKRTRYYISDSKVEILPEKLPVPGTTTMTVQGPVGAPPKRPSSSAGGSGSSAMMTSVIRLTPQSPSGQAVIGSQRLANASDVAGHHPHTTISATGHVSGTPKQAKPNDKALFFPVEDKKPGTPLHTELPLTAGSDNTASQGKGQPMKMGRSAAVTFDELSPNDAGTSGLSPGGDTITGRQPKKACFRQPKKLSVKLRRPLDNAAAQTAPGATGTTHADDECATPIVSLTVVSPSSAMAPAEQPANVTTTAVIQKTDANRHDANRHEAGADNESKTGLPYTVQDVKGVLMSGNLPLQTLIKQEHAQLGFHKPIPGLAYSAVPPPGFPGLPGSSVTILQTNVSVGSRRLSEIDIGGYNISYLSETGHTLYQSHPVKPEIVRPQDVRPKALTAEAAPAAVELVKKAAALAVTVPEANADDFLDEQEAEEYEEAEPEEKDDFEEEYDDEEEDDDPYDGPYADDDADFEDEEDDEGYDEFAEDAGGRSTRSRSRSRSPHAGKRRTLLGELAKARLAKEGFRAISSEQVEKVDSSSDDAASEGKIDRKRSSSVKGPLSLPPTETIARSSSVTPDEEKDLLEAGPSSRNLPQPAIPVPKVRIRPAGDSWRRENSYPRSTQQLPLNEGSNHSTRSVSGGTSLRQDFLEAGPSSQPNQAATGCFLLKTFLREEQQVSRTEPPPGVTLSWSLVGGAPKGTEGTAPAIPPTIGKTERCDVPNDDSSSLFLDLSTRKTTLHTSNEGGGGVSCHTTPTSSSLSSSASASMERAPSTESLNIRTDEKMPAKGEISEQESNGDMDVTSWNRQLYAAGENMSIYPSSYDLSTAQECWNLSSRNQAPFASIADSAVQLFHPHATGGNAPHAPTNNQYVIPRMAFQFASGSHQQPQGQPADSDTDDEDEDAQACTMKNAIARMSFDVVCSQFQQADGTFGELDLLGRQQASEAKYTDTTCVAGTSYFGMTATGLAMVPSVHGGRDMLHDRASTPKASGSAGPRPYSCAVCPLTFSTQKQRRLHLSQHSDGLVEPYDQEPQQRLEGAPLKRLTTAVVMNYFWVRREILRKYGPAMRDANASTSALTSSSTVVNITSTRTTTSELQEDEMVEEKSLVVASMAASGSGVEFGELTRFVATRYRIYVCNECRGEFSRFISFNQHLLVHPVECFACGRNFKQWRNFTLHVKRHLGVKEHQCRTCGKQFVIKQKLIEHMRIHTGVAPIKCVLCNRMFKRFSNLAQHRKRYHMNRGLPRDEFVCQLCGEVFYTAAKMEWHKETHEKKPKSCPYCREKFIHRNSLTRHIRLSHTDKYAKLENKTEPCTVCQQPYTKTSMRRHLETHTTERMAYACGICNKRFTTNWNLKQHKWTHANPTLKPFQCSYCPSAFVREADFVTHVNAHRSIRPYTCNHCGRQFIRKYNWIRHTREHELDKGHRCDVCGRQFHRKYYLTEHKRIHTGERPFSCNICGKTSATKTNHNKHLRIHHARDPLTAEG